MVNKTGQTTVEKNTTAKAEEFLKEEVSFMDEELELPNYKPKPKAVPVKANPLAKGSLLKRVREDKGLTLDMVQEATKIPLDSLRAIEEGYSVRTLSPFYYKGFVKIYCHYLGVDITEVLGSDFRIKDSSSDLVHKMPVEESNFLNIFNSFFTPQRKRQIFLLLGILFALFILFKIVFGVGHWVKEKFSHKKTGVVKADSSRRDDKVKKNDSIIEVVTPKTAVSRAKAEQDSQVENVADASMIEVVNPASAPSGDSAGAVVNKEIMLTVRSKKNSWLRVKTDGETVFQATLKQGAVETWAADDNIEISGKNLSQLDIELNGKMIGNLGRNNSQASTVVITKNGLSVIK